MKIGLRRRRILAVVALVLLLPVCWVGYALCAYNSETTCAYNLVSMAHPHVPGGKEKEMETQENITIRPYSISDYEQLCTILGTSFASKFGMMIGLDGQDLIAFLRESRSVNEYPHGGYWVASDGQEVLGVIELAASFLPAKESVALPNPSFSLKRIGLWKTITFFVGSALLSESPAPGEMYVKHIAVLERARGKGIGSLLFEKANELAEKHNCHSLSLHVALSNTGAYNLYQRLGFTTQKTTQSLLMKLFLAQYSWVRMVKPLRPSASGRLTMKRT